MRVAVSLAVRMVVVVVPISVVVVNVVMHRLVIVGVRGGRCRLDGCGVAVDDVP